MDYNNNITGSFVDSNSYLSLHINEGIDIFGRQIAINNRHNAILNTSLSGEPVKSKLHSEALDMDIDIYSIFKRMEISEEDRETSGLRRDGDTNPVIYALKREKGWSFKTKTDEQEFWRIFEHILRRWLREHKNNYDTVILVPSSRRLNERMMEMIKKIADEIGIKYFINRGLLKLNTIEVADMARDHKSFFYKHWTYKGAYSKAYEKLNNFLDMMDEESEIHTFRYHFISDMELRKTVLDTIKWDPTYKDKYNKELNNTNVLIIDDSITNGQSIDSTINTISNIYKPKTISVLTMFSKLYGLDGQEI